MFMVLSTTIGQHEFLLPINHKNYNFREKKNTKVWKGKICIKSFYFGNLGDWTEPTNIKTTAEACHKQTQ